MAGNRNLEEYLNNDDILEEWNLSGMTAQTVVVLVLMFSALKT